MAAAVAAQDELATLDYVSAAHFAGQVEDLSRTVEYLQLLAASTVDRTRTQAITAADAARTSQARAAAYWTQKPFLLARKSTMSLPLLPGTVCSV